MKCLWVLLWSLVVCFGWTMPLSAQVVFERTFDQPGPQVTPSARVVDDPERGSVLEVTVAADTPQPHTVSFPIDLGAVRGRTVAFGAEVRAESVSKPPQPWNGVKVMLIVRSPARTDYLQPEIPTGAFGWRRLSSIATIPADATEVYLVLGLEQVTGTVRFDDVRVRLRPQRTAAVPPAPATQPIFRGHDLPRLRGAMVGQQLTESDIEHFARVWGGNVIRWQFFEAATKDRPLDQYDAWLEGQLAAFDRAVEHCRKHGVKLVLDLHSPPGGQAFSAGYITARGDIFRSPLAQAKFLDVWRRIAARYKGNEVIWGFDLLNEPDDSMVSEEAMDWQDLAHAAALAVREVDPDRTLIVEPNRWGSPAAFAAFQPLPLPRIVYSFHFYDPHPFTHQGIHNNPAGITYPGEIAGKVWNKAALEEAMQPAIDFARKYRVHLYVGEFSAIRTAPPGTAAAYLADVTSLFEKHGFDWSYHAYREWQGWSLEHEGPLDRPRPADSPTDRAEVITALLRLNQRPSFR
jgi:hypothetical protein